MNHKVENVSLKLEKRKTLRYSNPTNSFYRSGFWSWVRFCNVPNTILKPNQIPGFSLHHRVLFPQYVPFPIFKSSHTYSISLFTDNKSLWISSFFIKNSTVIIFTKQWRSSQVIALYTLNLVLFCPLYLNEIGGGGDTETWNKLMLILYLTKKKSWGWGVGCEVSRPQQDEENKRIHLHLSSLGVSTDWETWIL